MIVTVSVQPPPALFSLLLSGASDHLVPEACTSSPLAFHYVVNSLLVSPCRNQEYILGVGCGRGL